MSFKPILNFENFFRSCNLLTQIKCTAGTAVFGRRVISNLRCFASATQNQNSQIKKAPRGPYMIFSIDKMAELRSSNPGLKIPELGKMVGKMWRDMPDNDKNIYREKFLSEKVTFQEEMKKLTEEEKKVIMEEEKVKRIQKHLKKIKTLRKKLGKPKPSDTNPYLLFAKSKMLERGDANLNQYVQGVSDFWKKMPEEDKKPFIDQAKSNSLKYRKELAEWEKEMMATGRTELISKSKLRAIAKTTKLAKKKPKKVVLKLKTKKKIVKKGRQRNLKSVEKIPTNTKSTATKASNTESGVKPLPKSDSTKKTPKETIAEKMDTPKSKPSEKLGKKVHITKSDKSEKK